MPPVRSILKWGPLGLVVLLLVIQLVPYGRDHTNPTGGRRIAWDSKRTEKLMTGACMDCHSDQTRWPWYSNVAPVSWLVQNDVDKGRAKLNLSHARPEVEEMVHEIESGEMPPSKYTIIHGDARLSKQEKQDLISGIRATFGGSSGP